MTFDIKLVEAYKDYMIKNIKSGKRSIGYRAIADGLKEKGYDINHETAREIRSYLKTIGVIERFGNSTIVKI